MSAVATYYHLWKQVQKDTKHSGSGRMDFWVLLKLEHQYKHCLGNWIFCNQNGVWHKTKLNEGSIFAHFKPETESSCPALSWAFLFSSALTSSLIIEFEFHWASELRIRTHIKLEFQPFFRISSQVWRWVFQVMARIFPAFQVLSSSSLP